MYNSGQFDPSFDEPDYAMVDTLFSLAEAYLFMQLVELKVWGDSRGGGGRWRGTVPTHPGGAGILCFFLPHFKAFLFIQLAALSMPLAPPCHHFAHDVAYPGRMNASTT